MMLKDEQSNENHHESAALPPEEQAVSDFWAFARDHVGWATLEGIFGQQQASTMVPPWMHLHADADQATTLAQELISAGTWTLEEPEASYPEDGDRPQRGDLAVVVDGRGRPVALVSTLDVQVRPATADRPDGGAGKLVRETLRCLYPTNG